MKLIYENICRESSLDKLAAEFPETYKVKDFDSNIPHEGVFMGSIEGCNWMKNNRPNVKFWSTFENYTCAAYYPKLQELLFNDKYAFIPFQDLKRRKWDIYAWLGNQAMVFIRPDSGEKATPAELVDIQDIDKFVDSYDYEGLAVVSSPKDMIGEWRLVCCGGEVIAGSSYKYQGLLTKVASWPRGAEDLARKVFDKGYEPDRIFCIDVVQDKDGEFWVMELTSFSSAGLYACDVKKIADLIKREYAIHIDK